MASETGVRVPPRPPRTFLPPSPDVVEPYRLTPQLALRLALLGGLALLIFGVLFLRLWALQVLSGDRYRNEALNNQVRTIPLEAPRGVILDRKGRVLVENEAATVIRVWPADLPKEGAYAEMRRLAKVVHEPLGRITREIEKRRGDPLTPVIVKVGASEREVLYLYEHQQDFRGVDVHETFLRRYPHRTLAAHVLGHVGEVTKEGLERNPSLRPGDRVGQAGVESAYDRYLRGRRGLAQLHVDSLGEPRSALEQKVAPKGGNAVRLTIDAELQATAERSLYEWIRRAQEQDCTGCWAANGGAIVALDPRNGAIRALASYPTFNPRVWTGRGDREGLARLLDPKRAEASNYPGVDRATLGQYPPGSTWKPVTALAAMEEQLVRPYDLIDCRPDFTAYKQIFKNWNPYVSEPMTMPKALEASCDTYFYELGLRFYKLPPERGHPLQAWAARFGFGKPTGSDIGPEAAGLLPTPEWRKATYTPKTDPNNWQIDRLWKPGDSIQLAIGQKDLQVTPLQMARFYAMVANGGKLVWPHVARDVEHPGDSDSPTQVLRVLKPRRPEPTGVDVGALQVVRQGLFQATHGSDGTSTAVFSGFPVDIAGKTGTAEKFVKPPGWTHGAMFDQSWWCGYGPFEAPELVVCTVVENGGHGGSIAAPASLALFEKYFGKKASYQLPSTTD